MSPLHVFVGSTNKVKINAVKLAMSTHFPDVVVMGYEVESGISAQPLTDEETRQGAENRARAALAEGLKNLAVSGLESPECLGIGLEGGVFDHENGELWSTVWGAIVNQEGQIWVANGARAQVPEPIASTIREGKEMGPVVQELTGIQDVKQLNGMIGVITQDFTNRTEEYSAISKLVLGLWYGRNWNLKY